MAEAYRRGGPGQCEALPMVVWDEMFVCRKEGSLSINRLTAQAGGSRTPRRNGTRNPRSGGHTSP